MSEGRTKVEGIPPVQLAPGFFDVPSGGLFPMQLSGLIPAALRDRGLARARDLARNGVESDGLDLTAPAALRPFVVAAVAGQADSGGAGRPVRAVPAPSREADDLADALGCLLAPDSVVVYPSWETLPHERLSPRSDT